MVTYTPADVLVDIGLYLYVCINILNPAQEMHIEETEQHNR